MILSCAVRGLLAGLFFAGLLFVAVIQGGDFFKPRALLGLLALAILMSSTVALVNLVEKLARRFEPAISRDGFFALVAGAVAFVGISLGVAQSYYMVELYEKQTPQAGFQGLSMLVDRVGEYELLTVGLFSVPFMILVYGHLRERDEGWHMKVGFWLMLVLALGFLGFSIPNGRFGGDQVVLAALAMLVAVVLHPMHQVAERGEKHVLRWLETRGAG